MIQQRRFFQAANGNDSMRQFNGNRSRTTFRPWGRIAVILTALLFLTSCASLTPDRVAVLAAIAGQAAQLGASQWLVKHPDQKPLFDSVIAAITALVAAGITDQHAYVEQLNKLPTATLAGPDGAVYVAEKNLVIRDEALNKSVVVKGPVTMPVVKATLRGLRKGVGPLPPVPVMSLPVWKRRGPPLGAPAATFAPVPAKSDAELNREFEEFQRKKAQR